MKKKLVTNDICIIGIGRFSSNLIQELQSTKMHIIAIDHDERVVNDISSLVDVAIIGDSTSEKFLKDNMIHNVDTIILGMSTDIQTSLLTATTLLDLGATNIIAKSTSITHEKILKKIGIQNIINPESVAAKKLSIQMLNSIMSSNNDVEIYDKNFSMGHTYLTNKKYFNTQIKDLDLEVEKVSLILVDRKGKTIIPWGLLELKEGDKLTLLGRHKVVYKVLELFNPSEKHTLIK